MGKKATSTTLYAINPVEHDGEIYAFGEKFEVATIKQAEDLIAAGAASNKKPEAADEEEAGA